MAPPKQSCYSTVSSEKLSGMHINCILSLYSIWSPTIFFSTWTICLRCFISCGIFAQVNLMYTRMNSENNWCMLPQYTATDTRRQLKEILPHTPPYSFKEFSSPSMGSKFRPYLVKGAPLEALEYDKHTYPYIQTWNSIWYACLIWTLYIKHHKSMFYFF